MKTPDPRGPLGARGEVLAASYLRERGYRILGRGYRARRREIDIIASRGRTIVFVEVKTRSRRDRFAPFLAVNSRKQARILGVARDWLARHRPPDGFEVRFDVVSLILAPGDEPEIEHIRDAFRPP